jgi:hypothetical protein
MVRFCILAFLLCGIAAAQQAPLPKRDFSRYLRPLMKPLDKQLAETKEWLIAKDYRCAHMITFVPPKDVDSSMVIPPGDHSNSMQVTPPMPVCAEDVRQLPEFKSK